MAANVESMFYVRKTPWHGLGTRVENALDSDTALRYAGLDWEVTQRAMVTVDGLPVPNYKANVRDVDNSVLGVVTNRYRVVQNAEAFSFTDALIGEGVTYETAGSLQNGRKVWILAKLPQRYIINGDEFAPYIVFMNSHDGSGAIKVAATPVRVVCQNTLNLALSTAKRTWSAVHTGDIKGKLNDARETLSLASHYMTELGKNFNELSRKHIAVEKAEEIIRELIAIDEQMPEPRKKNLRRQQEDVLYRYHEAPDLRGLDHNAYRLINAVSDFATHADPVRRRRNYQEALFAKVVDGHSMIDKAYEMVKAV